MYPCKDPNNYSRLAIPIFDILGNLVGVNCRRLDGVVKYPSYAKKYLMLQGFNTSYHLYLLHKILKNNLNSVIVVEGEISCLRMHTRGYNNTVAMSGASLSKNQATLLAQTVNEVTLLIEAGQAAEQGLIRSLQNLKKVGFFKVKVARLLDDDPDTVDVKVLEKALKEAYSA